MALKWPCKLLRWKTHSYCGEHTQLSHSAVNNFFGVSYKNEVLATPFKHECSRFSSRWLGDLASENSSCVQSLQDKKTTLGLREDQEHWKRHQETAVKPNKLYTHLV